MLAGWLRPYGAAMCKDKCPRVDENPQAVDDGQKRWGTVRGTNGGR
jgi:hypothetical protein